MLDTEELLTEIRDVRCRYEEDPNVANYMAAMNLMGDTVAKMVSEIIRLEGVVLELKMKEVERKADA